MKDTPLLRAAHNGHLAVCQYLVDNGAEVNTVDLGDNTSLHWAAMRGNVEIVNFLLQAGADKNIRNKQDELPIDKAKPIWSPAWRAWMTRLRVPGPCADARHNRLHPGAAGLSLRHNFGSMKRCCVLGHKHLKPRNKCEKICDTQSVFTSTIYDLAE